MPYGLTPVMGGTMLDTRRVIMLGGAAFAASVLITVVALLLSSKGGEQQQPDPSAAMGALRFRISDFVISDPVASAAGDEYTPYRDRLQRWDRDQVERFWIPIEEIARDILKEESDRAIEELLSSVD